MACPFLTEIHDDYCLVVERMPSPRMRKACGDGSGDAYRACPHYGNAVWGGLLPSGAAMLSGATNTPMVLLVDPAETREGCVQQVVERLGYRCMAVSEGREGLVVLRSGIPVGLIVMELVLPDMEGLQFLECVRRERPGVAVLVATDQVSIEGYLKAVNLGALDYLNKPVLMKELTRIVWGVLGRPEGYSAPHAA